MDTFGEQGVFAMSQRAIWWAAALAIVLITPAGAEDEIGFGASGDRYMKASRARQLEYLATVAGTYDLSAPRPRVVALAQFLDDCLASVMTRLPGAVGEQPADRIRQRPLKLITQTCLVQWESRR